jgi:hypothetical protein
MKIELKKKEGFDRYVIGSNGTIWDTFTNRKVVPHVKSDGRVFVAYKNDIFKWRDVNEDNYIAIALERPGSSVKVKSINTETGEKLEFDNFSKAGTFFNINRKTVQRHVLSGRLKDNIRFSLQYVPNCFKAV